MAPFEHVVTSSEALYERYRRPHEAIVTKKRRGVDPGSEAYIGRSPFVLIATAGADGGVDVSPRGGDPGFVRVWHADDADYVLVPDLNGNNLLDTLQGVIASGNAGLLFLVPSHDETVRVNGAAWVVTDDDVLDRFVELRRPKAAIAVRADEVFVHCAKAFRRSRLWQPESWEALADAPGIETIACAQGLFGDGVDPALVRADLEAGYAHDLALDRPES